MNQAMQRLNEAEFSDNIETNIKEDIAEMMSSHAQEAINENQNLLRTVMEESASRLKNGGPRYEIADQLLVAASASFEELCSQNVEIEVDEDLIPTRRRPEMLGHPVLLSLYRTVQLRDGISALEISGETPSDARQEEYRKALLSLRDTLNTHLKDSE